MDRGGYRAGGPATLSCSRRDGVEETSYHPDLEGAARKKLGEATKEGAISPKFHMKTSPGLATGRLPCSVPSCPRFDLCGEGRAPSPAPSPQGDSHHGPLPGASLENRSLSCVQPLAPPHEFSRVAFRERQVIRTRIRKIR